MGNVISAIHSVLETNPEDRFEKYIRFEETKFAEGRCRNAFMGTWVKPFAKRGEKCVVKNKKKCCSWTLNDWDVTLKIVSKAKQLSHVFNNFSDTSRHIHFVDVEVFRVVVRSDPHSYPMVNEYITVEKYLPGEFKKWCNNYGYISSDSISLPAFMHWSWVYTKGMLMVGDLQGVKYTNGYILTDPVIMSVNGEYGATDTGVEGMVMFFIHHECNVFCQDLPRPTVDDFLNHPQLSSHEVQACMETIGETTNSTTYKYDLKFRAEIRVVLIQFFRAYF